MGGQSDPIALISKWAKHTITNPHILFGDGARSPNKKCGIPNVDSKLGATGLEQHNGASATVTQRFVKYVWQRWARKKPMDE